MLLTVLLLLLSVTILITLHLGVYEGIRLLHYQLCA